MIIRIFGAILVVAASAGFSVTMAASCRQEEQSLRHLIRSLEFMSCELSYRQTPLPQLCRKTSASTDGIISALFLALGQALERQTAPDAEGCMTEVLEQVSLPPVIHRLLRELGSTLGCFDLPGQLRGIEGVISSAEQALRHHREEKGSRLRSYQTLAMCTGAALAILML